jgi:threonine dehydratase
MACRTPDPGALESIRAGTDHVVEVTDDEVEEAIRVLFNDTHNVVEGAGAAALAALLQERSSRNGQIAGIVLTGANIDPQPFARIIAAPALDSRTTRVANMR